MTKVLKIAFVLIILGSLFYVYSFFNPVEHSFFIPCPFNYVTGYHCPGCGSQRAIHQLLHFNVLGALKMNPLLVLSLPLLIFGVGVQIWNFIFETQYRIKIFYSNIFIYGYFIIVVLYWVIRNIPYEPFILLAPTN